MRILSITTLAILLVISGFAQNKETRSVDTFNKISFRTAGKVYVRQGSPQKVEIEGSQEALEKTETRVEDGKLVIKQRGEDRWFSWNWSDRDKVIVYITVKDIAGLSVSGSGDMIVQTKITANNLRLDVSGSGSLKAEVDAGDMDANVSGSGNMRVRGKCTGFDSNVSGSGDIYIENLAVAGDVEMDISGSGKIIASGSGNLMDASITGSGKVLASDFVVKKCRLRISGSGDVEINVTDDLESRITGSGSVSYRGNPSHVNNNSSGSGRVRKM